MEPRADTSGPSRSEEAEDAVQLLAGELRELRSRLPMSLRDLERELHFSDSTLSRYMAGQSLPPWEAVEGLCRLGGGDQHKLRVLWEQAKRQRQHGRGAEPSARTARAQPAEAPTHPDRQVAVDPAPTSQPAVPGEPHRAAGPRGRRYRRSMAAKVTALTALVVTAVAVAFAAGRARDEPATGAKGEPPGATSTVAIANNGPRGDTAARRALDVADSSTGAGTAVRLGRWRTGTDQGVQAQIWRADVQTEDSEGRRRWQLMNTNSGLCLDRGGRYDGASVFQWTCNDSSSQVWYFDAGRLRNELDGRCLDVSSGVWEQDAALEMAACGSAWGQRWYAALRMDWS